MNRTAIVAECSVSKRFVAGQPVCTQPPKLLLRRIESRRDDHPLRPRSVVVTFLLGATQFSLLGATQFSSPLHRLTALDNHALQGRGENLLRWRDAIGDAQQQRATISCQCGGDLILFFRNHPKSLASLPMGHARPGFGVKDREWLVTAKVGTSERLHPRASWLKEPRGSAASRSILQLSATSVRMGASFETRLRRSLGRGVWELQWLGNGAASH